MCQSQEERRIIFFLNQYQISRQISAAGVEKSILLSIEDIVLNRNWNLSAYEFQVYQPIKSLFDFAYESYHGNKKIKEIGETTLKILNSALNKIQIGSIGSDRERQTFIDEIKSKIKKVLTD